MSLIHHMAATPEVRDLVSKIPFQLAYEYAKQHAEGGEGTTKPLHLYNKKVFQRLSLRLGELLAPISYRELTHPCPNVHGKVVEIATAAALPPDLIDDSVEFHLRVMASPQRFEIKWRGKSTIDGSTLENEPSLYSHADAEGVPLDEPKTWYEAMVEDIGEGQPMVDVRDDGYYELETKFVNNWEKEFEKIKAAALEEKARRDRGEGEGIIIRREQESEAGEERCE